MTIRKVDLNLFRVFEAVYEHRSVMRASEQLGVSPSAISHALARLRETLNDELFIPGEKGMEPTPRAVQLAPGVTDGLQRLIGALQKESELSPTYLTRTFRIAATDYSASLFLPKLMKRLLIEAPLVDLRLIAPSRLDTVRQLDEGRADVILGWFGELPGRLRRSTLLAEHEALVVRKGHPLTGRSLTTERLFDYPHVVVELTGTEDQAVDGFLDDRGLPRRVWIERLLLDSRASDDDKVGQVAVSVPHFSLVPPLLLETDLVATLPLHYAQKAARLYGLALLEMPYSPVAVNLDVLWHQRSDNDAGLHWMITLIREAFEMSE